MFGLQWDTPKKKKKSLKIIYFGVVTASHHSDYFPHAMFYYLQNAYDIKNLCNVLLSYSAQTSVMFMLYNWKIPKMSPYFAGSIGADVHPGLSSI